MGKDCGPAFPIIVKFLQDKLKYRKRQARISADISARLFRVHVTCNKVSSILTHKNWIVDFKLDPAHFAVSLVSTWWIFTPPRKFSPDLENFASDPKNVSNQKPIGRRLDLSIGVSSYIAKIRAQLPVIQAHHHFRLRGEAVFIRCWYFDAMFFEVLFDRKVQVECLSAVRNLNLNQLHLLLNYVR